MDFDSNLLRPEAVQLISDSLYFYRNLANQIVNVDCYNQQNSSFFSKPDAWINWTFYENGRRKYYSLDNKIEYNKEVFTTQSNEKGNFADLEVSQVSLPLYLEDIHGSSVDITIKNNGTVKSVKCILAFYDGISIWDEFDDEQPYESYLIKTLIIPPINLQWETTFTLIFSDHGLYDPNYDVYIIVDSENFIEEPNEDDNKRSEFADG